MSLQNMIHIQLYNLMSVPNNNNVADLREERKSDTVMIISLTREIETWQIK